MVQARSADSNTLEKSKETHPHAFCEYNVFDMVYGAIRSLKKQHNPPCFVDEQSRHLHCSHHFFVHEKQRRNIPENWVLFRVNRCCALLVFNIFGQMNFEIQGR